MILEACIKEKNENENVKMVKQINYTIGDVRLMSVNSALKSTLQMFIFTLM